MFGERIRKSRKAKGLSQEQLARKLHVTQGAVSQWEKELTRPDFDLLDALAEALDTTVSYLLGSTDNPHRPTLAELSKEYEDELMQEMLYWSLDEAQRADPNRRELFLLAKKGSSSDVQSVCLLIDALRRIIPDFYQAQPKIKKAPD